MSDKEELKILRKLAEEIIDEFYLHKQYCHDKDCPCTTRLRKIDLIKEWTLLTGKYEEYEDIIETQKAAVALDGDKLVTIYDSQRPTILGYLTAELIKMTRGMKTVGVLANDMGISREKFIAELEKKPQHLFTKSFNYEPENDKDLGERINEWVKENRIIIRDVKLTSFSALVIYEDYLPA